MAQPTWITPAGNIGTFIELNDIDFQFSATPVTSGNTLQYILISGTLPAAAPDTPPIRLSTAGLLIGNPAQIANEISSTFTVRVLEYSGSTYTGLFADRTFSMNVIGATPPQFLTASGSIGNIPDSIYYEYQIQYSIVDPDTAGSIKLALGSIPPGLEINSNGYIAGYPDMPFDADGNPTTIDYEFTLQLTSESGTVFNQYSITVYNLDVYDTSVAIDSGANGINKNVVPVELTTGGSGTPMTLVNVNIVNDSGRFSCDPVATPLLVGQSVQISGTNTGTGIVANGFYTISSTNGVNGFTLINTNGTTVLTTAGSTTGLTFTTGIQSHGIVTGQRVLLRDVTGLLKTVSGVPTSQVNDQYFYALVVDSTTIQLYLDSELTQPLNLNSLSVSAYGGSGIVIPQAIRKPVLLNNRPLTLTRPSTEPDAQFYFSGTQIASVAQSTNFAFKFIGHDFEGRQIEYVINETPAFGLFPEEDSGWIIGTLPTIGGVIRTYSFYVNVVWTANPDIASDRYRFTIEVVGATDEATTWVTGSDLGSIDNTTISVKTIRAVSNFDSRLTYRIVGFQTDTELRSLATYFIQSSSPTGTITTNSLLGVGLEGGYVSSSSNVQRLGIDWTQNPALTSGNLNKIYSVVLASSNINQLSILGSYNDNTPLLQVSTDRVNWEIVEITFGLGEPFDGTWTDIIVPGNSNTFVLIGSHSRIFVNITVDGDITETPWVRQTNIVWSTAFPNTPTDVKLNGIAVNEINGRHVIVGESGTVLIATDGVGPTIDNWTWTQRDIVVNGTKVYDDFKSITWTGNPNNNGIFVAVGTNGNIFYSTDDGLTWNQTSAPTLNNLNFIYIKPASPRLLDNVAIVGTSGQFTCDAVSISEPLRVGDVVEISGTATGTGRVAGYSDPTIYRIIATNGSTTFTLGTNTLVPSSIITVVGTTTGLEFFSDELRYVFAGGDGGVLIRSIDGRTWEDTAQIITVNSLYNALYYTSSQTWYIVGDGGAILTSTDDGDTWSSPTLGRLPSNLYMAANGDIVGRVNYTQADGTPWPEEGKAFTFRAQAYSQTTAKPVATRDFTLRVNRYFTSPYQNLYMQAYPSLKDRSILNSLVGGINIIPQEYLYRADDPYFGKSQVIRYNHLYGVDQSLIQDYFDSINLNHYRRQITLGELKTARALDPDGNPLYEVVYSEIIDNLVNNRGVSIPKQITWPRSIPQPDGPWYTSVTNIIDTFTFYDPNPAYGVIATNYTTTNPDATYPNGTTTFTLTTFANIDEITIRKELTAAGVTNKADGTPPVVISVNVNTRQVVVDVQQGNNLAIGQILFFNDPVYTSLTNDPLAVSSLYPASLANMRQQIADSLGQLNDYRALPLWMSTTQSNGVILGFTPAWVICYVKPGYGQITINRINNLFPYKLNQINFGVDRFEVDNTIVANPPTRSNDNDWYIIFSQKNILPNSTT